MLMSQNKLAPREKATASQVAANIFLPIEPVIPYGLRDLSKAAVIVAYRAVEVAEAAMMNKRDTWG